MAVVSVTGGRIVSTTDTLTKKTRVVEYDVKVDDAQDGGSIVTGAAGIPTLLTTYAFGNDSDSTILLKSKVERYKQSNPTSYMHRVVTLTYDDEIPKEDPTKEPGEVEDDPYLKQMTPGFMVQRRVVDKALYRGFCQADENLPEVQWVIIGFSRKMPGNKMLPMTNSALDPVIPRPEDEEHFLAVRARYPLMWWNNDIDEYVGTINSTAVTLKWTFVGIVMFEQTFPAYTLLLKDVNPEVFDYKGVKTYMFNGTYVYNPDGWRHLELDQGDHMLPPDADQDQGADSENEPEQAVQISIRDVDGGPKRQVLLDGNGKPLNMEGVAGADSDEAVYLIWSIKDEKDFNISPLKLELE